MYSHCLLITAKIFVHSLRRKMANQNDKELIHEIINNSDPLNVKVRTFFDNFFIAMGMDAIESPTKIKLNDAHRLIYANHYSECLKLMMISAVNNLTPTAIIIARIYFELMRYHLDCDKGVFEFTNIEAGDFEMTPNLQYIFDCINVHSIPHPMNMNLNDAQHQRYKRLYPEVVNLQVQAALNVDLKTLGISKLMFATLKYHSNNICLQCRSEICRNHYIGDAQCTRPDCHKCAVQSVTGSKKRRTPLRLQMSKRGLTYSTTE